MELPRTVKIGYADIEIVIEDSKQTSSDSIRGDFFWDKKRIRICETMEGFEFAEVLIHELLHALIVVYGEPDRIDREIEEYVVDTFAKGLTTFERDNPGFLQEIMDGARSKVHKETSKRSSTRKKSVSRD